MTECAVTDEWLSFIPRAWITHVENRGILGRLQFAFSALHPSFNSLEKVC
jgi:hypothetical protein